MALIKRNDASEVKGLDAFHKIFPYMMKKRTDSTVYYQLRMNMEKAIRYLRKKNEGLGKRHYTYFILLIAALVRTVALRPHLNRFIARNRYYQRNEISFTFIVKKELSDDGEERNAYLVFKPTDTIEIVAEKVNSLIDECRNAEKVNSDKVLEILLMLPRFFTKFVVFVLRTLDQFGRMPKSLSETDGMHATIFMANLGSIGTEGAPVHHLYNWGTNSIFITVGRLHKALHVTSSGSQVLRSIVDLSISIDERISDGFYFIRSIDMFKKFVENPDLLEEPLDCGLEKEV